MGAPFSCASCGQWGDFDCAPGMPVGEGPALVGDLRFDICDKDWARAVEVAGSSLPDFGDQLGVDDAGDVGLPDLPDPLIEDSQINQRELVRKQVEVFADGDGGFEIAAPVVIEA